MRREKSNRTKAGEVYHIANSCSHLPGIGQREHFLGIPARRGYIHSMTSGSVRYAESAGGKGAILGRDASPRKRHLSRERARIKVMWAKTVPDREHSQC